jgi:ABC-2 type transport system permease protein
MSAANTLKRLSTSHALRRFGFRQTIRGALVIGFLTGIMMGAQGAAYAAAYPDQHSRDLLVASLKSAPGLGFMAGEIRDASTPASYSIYKSIALTTLIISVWGLLVTTRLFRGQEEDGRLEPIVAGHTTKRSASLQILIGFGYSLVIAFVVAFGCIAALGSAPKVDLPVGNAALLTLSVFLPGIFFAGVGTLTSQLAITRGRALAYGLVPLIALFTLRGAANSVTDWDWLKKFTPFGWTDLLNPVLDPQPAWIVPTVVGSLLFIPIGLYFAGKRDLGASIIRQSDTARSRFYLLGSAFTLSVRQNVGTFVWWCIGTLAYTGLLAAIAKVGADIIEESPAAAIIIAKLGGTHDDLVLAFLGFGGLFTALILLVMSAVCMGSVRQDEAKGYVDNLLIQPITRSGWLIKRLLLVISMITVISLLAGYLVWQIATLQDVKVDLWIILQNSIALMGTIILTIGIGTAFYGLLPRLTAIIMYAVIIWAFVVDVLKSFFSLNDFIDKTSLLHYVSFAPTKAPDWSTFAWLVVIGVTLMAAGIVTFTKRDIVAE